MMQWHLSWICEKRMGDLSRDRLAMYMGHMYIMVRMRYIYVHIIHTQYIYLYIYLSIYIYTYIMVYNDVYNYVYMH